MAVDAATKKKCNEEINVYKTEISEFEKDISAYKKAISQDQKLKPFLHLGITVKYLEQINLYMDMNDTSERMMDIKNNTYLDNARKLVYKIYTEIDQVVGMEVDEPLDYNREKLLAIMPFNPRQKLNFFKHVQKAVERLIKSYGENTKWRWSFPELNAKNAILGKNIIYYREMQQNRDPREEYFYDRKELLDLVKEGLFEASNQYRNKFELSTKSNNDLLTAVKLLQDLKRICGMMGDPEMMKKSQAGIDSYKARLEADDKKKNPVAKGKKKKKKK